VKAWIVVSVALASIATGLFVARPFLRQLYAPPFGKRSLRATWIGAIAIVIVSVVIGRAHPIVGSLLFMFGPAIGVIATFLCRDAYNRARGLPADYLEIPEGLRRTHRALFALLSAGFLAGAAFLLVFERWRAVRDVWVLAGAGVGFGTAAMTGRLSHRMRPSIGAAPPQPEILERSAGDR